jgi:ABC-type bacteriocin/lantibiotic exporter with double-glycine peptidase domain
MKFTLDLKKTINSAIKIKICIVVLVTLSERLIFLAPVVIVGQIIDLIASGEINQIQTPLLILLFLGGVQAVLWPMRERFVASVVQSITLERSIYLTKNIFDKNYEVFAPSRVGYITKITERAVEGFERLLYVVLTQVLPAISAVILILIYFIFLLPIAIPVLVLGACVFLSVSLKLLRWRRNYLDKVNDTEDAIADSFASTFLAGRAIKSNGTINASLAPLIKTYKRYAKSAEDLSFASGVLASAQSIITLIVTVSAIYGGVKWMDFQPNFTAGSFAVVFSYVGVFMTNLSVAWQIRESFDEYEADIRALSEIEDIPVIESKSQVREDVVNRNRPDIHVSGNNISVPKIKDNITIPFGALVSVSGQSGAGKTTLAQSIFKLKSTDLQVKIGKHDLRALSVEKMVQTVSYSWQDPQFLFGNWDEAVFLRKLTKNELEQASIICSKLGISHLFLPNNINFRVDHLSGGERKRLSLLRVLLYPKPIIVLDEPTSELDQKHSEDVYEIVKKMKGVHTVILVTHDQRLRGICDLDINIDSSGVNVSTL